jgi:Ni/Co efflux regulator RcnB
MQLHRFLLGSYERKGWNMRKLSLALAALATIAVAAPTMANAEEFGGVGVRVGGDHFRDRGEFRDRDEFRGARAEFRDHDRGFRRDFDRERGDRTVIIKRRHQDW